MSTIKTPDHLFHLLRKKAVDGSLVPGTKLPSERKLSGEYNVSRTTVREAINRLEQLGLVTSIPKSGTFVNNFETDASLDLLISIMRSGEPVSSETLVSLVEFRRLAELYAVRRAMSGISREDVECLRGFVDTMKRNAGSPETLAEMDFRIHFAFVRIARNMVIQLMFNSFKPVYRYYTDFFYRLDGASAEAVRLHERLIEALASEDAEYAVYAMEKVLLYGENRLKDALGISEKSTLVSIPSNGT